jgi:general secretion pathway protein E
LPDHLTLLLAAEAATLVDWLKPVLFAAIFIPWGWLVSSRLEGDARYFNLDYHRWNLIHMAAGALAVVAVLLIPIFWVGWPVAMLILLGPILAYWKIRNAAVPAERQYHLTSATFKENMAARRSAKAERTAKLVYFDSSKKPLPVPTREEPLFNVHLLTEQILEPVIASRAYRVELGPGQGGYMAWQVIDGVRYRQSTVPPDLANAAIDYLKRAGGLDVQDRRRRQTGQFRMRAPGTEVLVDIAVSGSASGQTMRLDFDRGKRVNKPLDTLGLLPPQQELISATLDPKDRHGVYLVGAPQGHGLTTTCYSLLGRHDAFTSNIKTLERHIELHLDGVDHTAFDADNPAAEYSTNLQSILRRDPDIVLLADLKDSGTGRIAAGPGLGGPLIYVPSTADSTIAQWMEWSKAVGDPKKAASALRVIMNQRLLRAVCPQCRQPSPATPEQLKRLGLPAGKSLTIFRAGGKVQVKNRIEDCPLCRGLGYFGQIAAFEVMPVDEETRKLLAVNDFKGAVAIARRARMLFLAEAALAKVREGQTTLEEVVRVLSPKGGEATSAGGPQPAAPAAGGPPPPQAPAAASR